MKKILNFFGLYTKADLIQSFKNGQNEEQGKMYFINESNFRIKGVKIKKKK